MKKLNLNKNKRKEVVQINIFIYLSYKITMKYGILFGAGAEIGYGLPSGGKFALDIFRYDVSKSKKNFK